MEQIHPERLVYPIGQENEGHPTVFPDELALRIIKMYSFVGETVLDPFLGSGTTIKVARELGREGIGYEREEALYRGVIESKLEGTLSKEDSEPKETLTEYSERQLEELEAIQPVKSDDDDRDYAALAFGSESDEREPELA